MDATNEMAQGEASIDDLFDYDVGLDDIFKDRPDTTTTASGSKPTTNDPTSLGLGLDEEVKVTKQRRPNPKLDEARLLSQPGIPKLRRTAKQKLRFKGKGYEFQDAERLLNFYQLWLDDLFPRAKFADGLAIIEKLGHTKRIQTMRKEWIEEEKPKPFYDRTNTENPSRSSTEPNKRDNKEKQTAGSKQTESTNDGDLFMQDPEAENRPPVSHPQPDDDELEDLLREQDEEMTSGPPASAPRPDAQGVEPDDDDLEDLLREQDEVMADMPKPASRAAVAHMDDFDAEYEAMNEMGL
ncbi:Chromosome segregation in meiosis protein 3 [Penicillium diatomitis]|uniref:Chromosome segregation in meiosis protein n=1 Tax=Penicillium diatomitis TaxID=2819901 RepID=A0A9X0BSU0_9EURO|nr:Chromosome segregation in meiosis protein 3 [Penicillium diatomitis]KAJ5480981.1 Chromosome segregation in meiosis protein 3 [Penicillium diatomitis]